MAVFNVVTWRSAGNNLVNASHHAACRTSHAGRDARVSQRQQHSQLRRRRPRANYERHGIRVHEAWWLQAGNARSTIVPRGEVEILKSHYERVSRGKMDFRKVPRIYYLTDTFYMPRWAVEARQPGAVLLKSFPKPEGNESVDVYRLK